MAHPQPGEATAFGASATTPTEGPRWPGAAGPDAAAPATARSRGRASRAIGLALWHRRLVVATAVGLALTGVAWMAARQGLALFPDLDGVSARARLHALLVLHGVLGYAGAVLLGSLLGGHIPAGLRSGRRRVTGLAALGLAGGLVLTALLLYYAGSDGLRGASSAAHQVLGVVAIAAVWIHAAGRERPGPRSRTRPGPTS